MQQDLLLCIKEFIPIFLIKVPKNFKDLLVTAVGASGGVPVHPKDALFSLSGEFEGQGNVSLFYVIGSL